MTILSDQSVQLHQRLSWGVALLGQVLFVFCAVALSGPGRLDIDDGQARFEVAQSLVDHGDPAIRDPGIWYTVLPGRYGLRYSNYRLPHSAIGTVAIWLADRTGPTSAGRRHFFFTMIGAVAAACLAVTYTWLFRRLGWPPMSALLWGTAGIFCTPCWYYGTSTFDDILCAAVITASVAIALGSRHRWPIRGAIVSGLLLGLAFNCKQPLAIFVFTVWAAQYDRSVDLRRQWSRFALSLLGLVFGAMSYEAYEWYKFPPETLAAHAAILKQWGPVWTNNPLPGVLSLLVSPGAGAIWYCPPVILACVGLAAWWGVERKLCAALVLGSVVFVVFFSFLTFFKGDMAWGPRYLTPIFALLWIFVPAAASRLRPRLIGLVLGLGVIVQLLGLSVDPHRLYLQRNLWSRFYAVDPWIYFDPAVSHLVNRPREIVQILADTSSAEAFSPSRTPTDCLPILEWFPGGPDSIHRYRVLSSFRLWWLSQRCLPEAQRPVDLAQTAELILKGLALGAACMLIGAWWTGRSRVARVSADSTAR